MLDSRVEPSVPSRESPPPLWSRSEGGGMRYHGLDLHKGSAAVSIRDEAGHETRYVAKVETASYVATLGSQDSVALESGCGSFLWAERIQRRGARCIVIDPYRFRIIRDSWHKTDRHDAGALSLALWTAAQSGELVLPTVWQPTPEVRELRRLFSHWQLVKHPPPEEVDLKPGL